MSSFSLLGLIVLVLVSCEARNVYEESPREYMLGYFSQANDYQQNYYRQCINVELLVRHIPVEERTFKYFYQLAKQIYASRRYLHDLLVAGEVTILTIARDNFETEPLDPVTSKQVESTEVINTLMALLANFFNTQKYELPQYEYTNCIDCLTAEEKYSSEPKTCKYSRYYEADGSCLNPKLPGAGAVNREYRRLAQPFNTLGGETNTCQLPNARKVSLAVQAAVNKPYDAQRFPEVLSEGLIPNTLTLFMAQLNAHDHAYARTESNVRGHLGHAACTVDQRKPLDDLIVASSSVPIAVDCTDPFYSQFNVSCLNFVKSQKLNEDCRLRVAGALNQITTVEDLDTNYVRNVYPGREFLNSDNGDVLMNEYGTPVIADHRSMQHLGLFTISYFFSRLHNLIAEEVRHTCSHLSGYDVFQTARSINIAMYQHLFYDRVLGAFIGDAKVEENQLNSDYDSFDEYQEPEMLSEYACAAGRVFHKFVPDDVLLFDSYGQVEGSIPFRDTFYFDDKNVELLNKVGHSSAIQEWKTNGYTDQITNYLFNDRHLCYGTDMLSIDVQRNRDCALKPYVHYLNLFFDVCIRDWDDLRGHISDDKIDHLRGLYTTVEDVDLRVGIDLENEYERSVFGKTATRILVEQHRRLKNDPKWWTRIFNAEQQAQIRSPTLSDLVCIVFGYDHVVKDARWAWSKVNPIVECRARYLRDVFDVTPFCNYGSSYY